MLMALGPRLRRLSMHYEAASLQSRKHSHLNNLLPAVLRHCPVLTHLALDDLQPRNDEVLSSRHSCCAVGFNNFVMHCSMSQAAEMRHANALAADNKSHARRSSMHCYCAGIDWGARIMLQPAELDLPSDCVLATAG